MQQDKPKFIKNLNQILLLNTWDHECSCNQLPFPANKEYSQHSGVQSMNPAFLRWNINKECKEKVCLFLQPLWKDGSYKLQTKSGKEILKKVNINGKKNERKS